MVWNRQKRIKASSKWKRSIFLGSSKKHGILQKLWPATFSGKHSKSLQAMYWSWRMYKRSKTVKWTSFPKKFKRNASKAVLPKLFWMAFKRWRSNWSSKCAVIKHVKVIYDAAKTTIHRRRRRQVPKTTKGSVQHRIRPEKVPRLWL